MSSTTHTHTHVCSHSLSLSLVSLSIYLMWIWRMLYREDDLACGKCNAITSTQTLKNSLYMEQVACFLCLNLFWKETLHKFDSIAFLHSLCDVYLYGFYCTLVIHYLQQYCTRLHFFKSIAPWLHCTSIYTHIYIGFRIDIYTVVLSGLLNNIHTKKTKN